MWFDGANGGSGYYGGARETRSIDGSTYYDWPTTLDLVRSWEPNIIFFSDAGPGVRWVGNERGIAGETNWCTFGVDTIYPGKAGIEHLLNTGMERGDRWIPAEVDLVANVAPIFKNLLGFLTAAEALAGDALALVQNVGPGTEKFYFGELYPLLLGRHYPPREDYLNTLTLLHSLGIYPNTQIVSYQFDQPFATLQDAVDFWTEQMHLTESNQQRKLRSFLHARLQPTGSHLIAPMRRRSAVIWWRVASKDSP